MVARSDSIRNSLWKPYVRFRGKGNMRSRLVDRFVDSIQLEFYRHDAGMKGRPRNSTRQRAIRVAPHESSDDKGFQFARDTLYGLFRFSAELVDTNRAAAFLAGQERDPGLRGRIFG